MKNANKISTSGITMISDACIAYSRTDNYQDFENYYRENASISTDNSDNIEKLRNKFARHRAYLNADTVDEFKTYLKREYGLLPVENDKVLVKKK